MIIKSWWIPRRICREDLVRELDVKVIPFPFTINGISYKHYPDQREMAVADFYRENGCRRSACNIPGKSKCI